MTNVIEDGKPLYSSFGSDPDLGELVELFVDELPDRIASIEAQLADADWAGVSQTAHQMKGAAGSYGFDALTPWAARLENLARAAREEDAIRSAASDLIAVCRLLRSGSPG